MNIHGILVSAAVFLSIGISLSFPENPERRAYYGKRNQEMQGKL